MNILEVNKVNFTSDYPDLKEISDYFDKSAVRNPIDQINWQNYRYKPEVSFLTGYTSKELLLKFYVTEEYFKAEKTESNHRVFEDSCVELFVAPEEDGIYYNLEFNGIGTCLLGAGKSRKDRIRGNEKVISRIRRITSAGKTPVPEIKGLFSWTLTLAVPFDVFFNHRIKSLTGKTFRSNFHKCGDKLTMPHYVTWNPIKTEKPDFHQPSYFGLLKFK
jgi:hypothetical protein